MADRRNLVQELLNQALRRKRGKHFTGKMEILLWIGIMSYAAIEYAVILTHTLLSVLIVLNTTILLSVIEC